MKNCKNLLLNAFTWVENRNESTATASVDDRGVTVSGTQTKTVLSIVHFQWNPSVIIENHWESFDSQSHQHPVNPKIKIEQTEFEISNFPAEFPACESMPQSRQIVWSSRLLITSIDVSRDTPVCSEKLFDSTADSTYQCDLSAVFSILFQFKTNLAVLHCYSPAKLSNAIINLGKFPTNFLSNFDASERAFLAPRLHLAG